jgi:methylmalonyl-CoA mutase
MAKEQQQLFQDFPSISQEEWVAKIEKDLKGKSLDILDYSPELGIKTKAYFHKDDNIPTNELEGFDSNDWFLQENFSGTDNKKILEHLQLGCDSVQVDVDDTTHFKKLFTGVELEYISTEFRYKDKANWNNLNTFLSNNKSSNVGVSFPVLTNGIEKGVLTNDLKEFNEFYKALVSSEARRIHIDGFTFGLAGASTIQELAICLAQLSEYTQSLIEEGLGLEEIADSFYSTLSVNDEYFTNIAKFRAYQILLGHFFKSFDDYFDLDNSVINGQTNYRHMAKNDRYNNLLRSTTQAMSAILGGCANLQVTPFDKSNVVSERMARNIQLILKEEAYFDKVNDPSAGSYYIEDLTNQLVEKAWALFLNIEEQGGYISGLKSNYIQNEIQKNKVLLIEQLNSNDKMLLGVNKYQNTLEDWIKVDKSKTTIGKFKALDPFILENYYTKSTEK